jgi:hypothetical protein
MLIQLKLMSRVDVNCLHRSMLHCLVIVIIKTVLEQT